MTVATARMLHHSCTEGFSPDLGARGSDSFTVRGQEMGARLCSVKV